RLVESGEVDALVAERVWQELAKGLMAERPGRMFEVLEQTGALPRIMPQLVYTEELGAELAIAHEQQLPLAARYAILCRLTPEVEALGKRLRAPSACVAHALLLQELLKHIDTQDPDTMLAVME